MNTHGACGLATLACLAVSAAAAAQGDRETRDLTGFDAVAVGGGIDLFLHQGESFRVEVAAGDGDLDEIVTEVAGSKLDIRRRRPASFLDWGDRGTVSVTLPRLTAVTASGGSEVEAEGTFTADVLEIVASGGSDLEIDVAAGTLDVTASGGSDLELRGSARSARLQASGGSDVDGTRLMVDEVEVQSSGGSDVGIGVRNKIVANASGGSDISYTGQPSIVQVNSSGGGDVRRR